MKRKDYQTPTMKVVQLRHTGMIMTSTEGRAVGMRNYTKSSYEEE